jgi:hypothetical protein
MQALIDLIVADPIRLAALQQVAQLQLPQGYIAAGFVRNLVWDALYQKVPATPLCDVDVIFYDPLDCSEALEQKLEQQLTAQLPQLQWQVRNQARMHLRNQDPPYQSCLDAMQFWPEKETAVAVRLLLDGRFECISAFGFARLWQGQITHNPVRSADVFANRVNAKAWLTIWPQLVLVSADA